jgi:hypothetical protein
VSQPPRVGDLEVNQDIKHEELTWRLQRIGWGLMLLLVVAALVGLLGPGPLSAAQAGKRGSPLWVEYNRFERYQSPVLLRVHVGPQAVQQGKIKLYISRQFIENIELERINPEPQSVELGVDTLAYSFDAPNLAASSTISFHFQPNTWGRLPLHIALQGGPRAEFSQFLYP